MPQEINDLELKVNQLEKILQQKNEMISDLEKLIFYMQESKNRSFDI